MIAVVAPEDRAIVLCTLGTAWELAMYVHRHGWTEGAEEQLANLAERIGLWHQGGLGRWWS